MIPKVIWRKIQRLLIRPRKAPGKSNTMFWASHSFEKYFLNTFPCQAAVWEFEGTTRTQPQSPVLTEPFPQLEQESLLSCEDRQVDQKWWAWTVSHWLELPGHPAFLVVCLAVPRCTLAPGSHSSLSELKLQPGSASPCFLWWPYDNLVVKNLHPREWGGQGLGLWVWSNQQIERQKLQLGYPHVRPHAETKLWYAETQR